MVAGPEPVPCRPELARPVFCRRPLRHTQQHLVIQIRREEFGVLTLTDEAVNVLRELTAQPGLSAEAGLRIAPPEAGADGLALSLAQGPQAGDQVIEDAGVHVYVQPDAAAALDDKALDARIGETGEVSFQLQPRA
jgi:iron-sulfur cluster assembly protein